MTTSLPGERPKHFQSFWFLCCVRLAMPRLQCFWLHQSLCRFHYKKGGGGRYIYGWENIIDEVKGLHFLKIYLLLSFKEKMENYMSANLISRQSKIMTFYEITSKTCLPTYNKADWGANSNPAINNLVKRLHNSRFTYMHCNLTILVPQESSDSQRTLFLCTLCEPISKLIKVSGTAGSRRASLFPAAGGYQSN